MYAIRDAQGHFVGRARSKVGAHRRTRQSNRVGASVSNRAYGRESSALRIARWLQRDGHGSSPADIRGAWGMSESHAQAISDVATAAFGPGGKGEAWATRRIVKILASDHPRQWTRVPEHDAWIKEFHFAAVSGWSKTTTHGVAVRRESKGSKDWRIDRMMFGGGWQAVTSVRYKSAAEARREADKIFKVFTIARAKGAEIDLDTLVDNDGQIRWHDTHLGLAGVRREDLNMAGHSENVWVIDGVWRLPDGTPYPYTGFAGQASGGSAYEARRGADGNVHYLVNGKSVAALPKTPTTKALMAEFNKMEHVSRLVSVDASGHIVYPERSHGTLGPWKSSANRAGGSGHARVKSEEERAQESEFYRRQVMREVDKRYIPEHGGGSSTFLMHHQLGEIGSRTEIAKRGKVISVHYVLPEIEARLREAESWPVARSSRG